MQSNPMTWLIAAIMALGALISFLHEPEGDHPKAWVRWDDGNYSVHPENELRAATIDGPRLYKEMA